MNETLYSYFADFEDQFLHWYAATYGPHWNMSLEEEANVPFTRPTLYSPVTQSDEFYIYEKSGILPMERKRRAVGLKFCPTVPMKRSLRDADLNEERRVNKRRRRHVNINGDPNMDKRIGLRWNKCGKTPPVKEFTDAERSQKRKVYAVPNYFPIIYRY